VEHALTRKYTGKRRADLTVSTDSLRQVRWAGRREFVPGCGTTRPAGAVIGHPHNTSGGPFARALRRGSASCRWILLGLLLSVSAVTPSFAQQRSSHADRPTPFERYVPASANLFLAIRGLGDVDAALHRAHAWRLLPMWVSGTSENQAAFDLRAAVTALVGPHSSIAIDELMQAEAGIVATGWAKLGSAVWFVHLSDRNTFDRWFPTQLRRGEARTGPLLSFTTRDGMLVRLCGDVAALTRGTGDGALLRDVERLMARRGGTPLERSAPYRELVNRVPDRHLAIVYWVGQTESVDEGADAGLWPALDRAVVALYEREGRIDLAIRASRASPRGGIPIGRQAIQSLMQLPQTTLFALAARVRFDDIYNAARSTQTAGVWRRYLTVLAGMAWRASSKPETSQDQGVHMIFIWGQDLRENESAPQLAIMIEPPDPLALRSEVTRIARNLLRLVQPGPTLPQEAVPAIVQTSHLGTAILHVPLRAYAEKSQTPTGRLLGGLDPAWTVWRNWFIFALSHDHLERILDGQHGLIPTLASVRDAGELRDAKAGRTVLGIAQAALATDVLDRWLSDHEAGGPSLLAPNLWERAARPAAPASADLNIGWRSDPTPGVALVTTVPPDSGAKGLLQPNDHIVGVDGRMLDLESPSADLAEHLSKETTRSSVTFRVQRSGTLIDVVVPLSTPNRPPISPADAVREFASLGRTLRFATMSVHATGERHYSARLSLRFAPDAPP